MSIRHLLVKTAARPFVIALALSLICLTFLFLIARPIYADANANSSPSFGAPISFGEPPSITRAIVITDTNGDGSNDIIAGVDGGQNLIYIGSPQGVSASTKVFGTGRDATRSIAAANVDGKDKVDIVVGNYGQQSMVYLNDGIGTFDNQPTPACPSKESKSPPNIRCFGEPGSQTLFVTALPRADDSKQDILAVNVITTGLEVIHHKNDGNNFFDPEQRDRQTLEIKGDITSIAFGTSISGTVQEQDLVVAGRFTTQADPTPDWRVAVCKIDFAQLPNGSNSCTDAEGTLIDNLSNISSVAVADLDRNGTLDVVVGESQTQSAVYLRDIGETIKFSDPKPFGDQSDVTQSIAIADIDGINGPDIVAGNYGSSVITNTGRSIIYKNNGEGQFTIGQRMSGDAGTYYVVAGQLNSSVSPNPASDRYVDIVTVGISGTLVFTNSGGLSHTFGLNSYKNVQVAADDVDNDAHGDIIAAAEPGHNLVYLNDKVGGLKQPITFTTPITTPQSIATGDLNGDTLPEIVVGSNGKGRQLPDKSNAKDPSAIYINQNGSFTNAITTTIGKAGDNITSVAIGSGYVSTDMRRYVAASRTSSGGVSDIILYSQEITSDTMLPKHIDCPSTSPGVTCIDPKGEVSDLAITNVNTDTLLDLIVGKSSGQGLIYINLGDGTFKTDGSACSQAVRCFGKDKSKISQLAVADIDGQARADIVTIDGGAGMIYRNEGNGYFTSTTTFAPIPFDAQLGKSTSLAVGKVNSDTFPDIVVGKDGEPGVVYYNDTHGRFDTSIDCAYPLAAGHYRCVGSGVGSTSSVAIVDLDGQGEREIVLGSDGLLGVSTIDSGIQWQGTPIRKGDLNSCIVIADVDNDGKLDLIVGNRNGPNAVYLNTSNGNVGGAAPFGDPTNNTESIAVGDTNRDGWLDIITGGTGQGRIYLNDKHGGFSASRTVRFGSNDDNLLSLAVADVNRDGRIDIIAGNAPSFLSLFGFTQAQSAIYLGQPTIAPTSTVYYSTTSEIDCNNANVRCFGHAFDEVTSVAAADLDGDTKIDIVTGGYPSQIYFNTDISGGQTSVFTRTATYGDGLFSYRVAIADMDGDDHLDIVAGRYGQSNVYLNNGTGNFSTTLAFGGSNDWTNSVAVADMNGDGALDIIAGNVGTGQQPGQSRVYLQSSGHFIANSASCASNLTRCYGSSDDVIVGVAAADIDGVRGIDLVSVGYPKASAFSQSRSVVLNQIFLNDGNGRFGLAHALGQIDFPTQSLAIADIDGDSTVDVIAGSSSLDSRVYLNHGTAAFSNTESLGTVSPFTASLSLKGSIGTNSIAVGDLDGKNGLDLVLGMNGQSRVYFNENLDILADGSQIPISTGQSGVQHVAMGDLNHDNRMDLVIAKNGGQGVVFLSSATTPTLLLDMPADTPCTAPHKSCFGGPIDSTVAVALADIDNDGYLDIVAGNTSDQSRVYLNDGAGRFQDGVNLQCGTMVRCFGTLTPGIISMAVANLNGDNNGDDDVDIVVRADKQQGRIYLNNGSGGFSLSDRCDDPSVRCFGDLSDTTGSLAIGDMDSDGKPDIVAGNTNGLSWIYLNDGNAGFVTTRLVTNRLNSPNGINSVALGDLNNDGALDLVAGDTSSNSFALNGVKASTKLLNNPPQISVGMPDGRLKAGFSASPIINLLRQGVINIPFSLHDPEGDAVRAITASYSLDGGGRWRTAVGKLLNHSDAITVPTSCGGQDCTYKFAWDTGASDFFGQSDNVMVRIELQPDVSVGSRSIPGSYQHPIIMATTYPFRAHGKQVQIVSSTANLQARVLLPLVQGRFTQKPPTPCETKESPCKRVFLPAVAAVGMFHEKLPIPSTSLKDAIVYRLPAGTTAGALPIGGPDDPLRTDAVGFLRGRGEITEGDQLVALLRMTDVSTTAFDLYYTSARPTPNGLAMHTVDKQVVQQLLVSADNPLVLFKLNVSLEWDASTDAEYLNQLKADLRRASELLYEWSNGQAALGDTIISQNRANWDTADIRVYASNRLRPNALQGGITKLPRRDPLHPDITYSPGQVRIGPVWNRYGDTTGSFGEDWPRALAHELGHYLLYLDDNYLGLDTNGILIPLPNNSDPMSCSGPMANPYPLGPNKYNTQATWNQHPICAQTLAAKTTNRWDWFTITTFYPWLNGTNPDAGPRILPLDITRFADGGGSIAAATTRVLSLINADDGTRAIPNDYARAFLFRNDSLNDPTGRIVDLGHPAQDQLLVRGAQDGDEVCVYEMSLFKEVDKKTIPIPRTGCTTITPTNDQLRIGTREGWAPEVIVRPISSTLISAQINHIPANQPIRVDFFSTNANDIHQTQNISATVDGTYTAVFSGTAEDLRAGYVRVRSPQDSPQSPLQIVTDYSLGGGPVSKGRTGGGGLAPRQAPAVSADGQVILYAHSRPFTTEQVLNLQAATYVPPPPKWATIVGQAYWLTGANIPDLRTGISLSFNYLGREVPVGEEPGLTVYVWKDGVWSPIESSVRDISQNFVSAPSQGSALYALMSSVEIDLKAGWNQFAYPVKETRLITEALASIDGCFSYVFTSDPSGPVLTYEVGQPDSVNTLKELKFGQGYTILMTKSCKLRLKGPVGAPNPAVSSTSGAQPAAIYYGTVVGGNGFTSAGGVAVLARINGVVCGRGTTFERNGTIVYAVPVSAEQPGTAGCGRPGQPVTFQVGSRVMATVAQWDSDRPRELALQP